MSRIKRAGLNVGDHVVIFVGTNRQLVEATIIKIGPFRTLCSYGVRETWDGGPPIRDYTKISRIFNHRIVGTYTAAGELRPLDATVQE